MRIQKHRGIVRYSSLLILAATIVTVGVYIAIIGQQRMASAAPVPESCFTFNSGTGAIQDYNVAANPLCLDDVTIPATIGGTPVTTIAGGAFDNPTLTAVTFPSSISLIESNAFPVGVELDAISLSTSSDLTIQSGAFSVFNGASLSISSGGNLSVDASFNGSSNLTSVSLNATGSVTIGNASFSSVVSDSLSITAGGQVTVWQGSFSGSDLDAIAIDAVGDVTVTQGALYGASLSPNSILIESDAHIVADSSAFSDMTGIVGTINLNAGGSLTLETSAFSNISAGTISFTSVDLLDISTSFDTVVANSLTAVSEGDINLYASLSNLTIPTISLSAAGALTIDSAIYSLEPTPDMSVSLESGTGLMSIYASLESDSVIETLSIIAPSGLSSTGGSLYQLSALTSATLDLGGDVLLQNGAFSYSLLSDLTIQTDGNIDIPGGSLGDMANLETLTVNAGGYLDIGTFGVLPQLTSVSLTSGSDMTIRAGTFYDSPSIQSAAISSGGTLTIENGVFSDNVQMDSLTLAATGDVVIGEYVFTNNNLTEVTFPSGLQSIGQSSFMLTDLDRVSIPGSPTLGDAVFSLSGVSYDVSTFEYLTYEQLKYVQLYTSNPSNPAGYTDTFATPIDIIGSPDLEHAGGYIVNPALITSQFQDADTNSLSADNVNVGELPDGTDLINYLVSWNPTDFAAYFRPGDTVTFDAPDITGYITPDPIELVLLAGNNIASFIYVLPQTTTVDPEPESTSGGTAGSGTPGVPNTGIVRIMSNPAVWMISLAVFASAVLFALLYISRKKQV